MDYSDDSARQCLADFLAAWHDQHGTRPVHYNDLCELAHDAGCVAGWDAEQACSRLVCSMLGRRFAGYVITGDDGTNSHRFTLARALGPDEADGPFVSDAFAWAETADDRYYPGGADVPPDVEAYHTAMGDLVEDLQTALGDAGLTVDARIVVLRRLRELGAQRYASAAVAQADGGVQ